MRLAAQSAQIGVGEAALYPSISLVGTVGLSATSLDWSARTFQWGVGPFLVWNIFDWGRLKTRCWSRMHASSSSTSSIRTPCCEPPANDAPPICAGRAQVDILREAVQAARRSLDIATIQYREGLVGERVLDSQRSLFNQQERLSD